MPKSDPPYRSACPVSTTLDIVGDHWTLVLVRDLVTGKSKFGDFLASPERITASVLTDRLAKLERHGLVTRHPYQTRPVRYEYRLTTKGRALLPILQEMCRWANRFVPDTWTAPDSFMALRIDGPAEDS